MKSMFKVDGMKCMNCVANVTKTLESLQGVKSADVDLEAAQATIEGDVAAEDVCSALAAAGYAWSLARPFFYSRRTNRELAETLGLPPAASRRAKERPRETEGAGNR